MIASAERADGTIGLDETIEWRDAEGRLDRADGPAATYPDGRRIWFVEGEKVREERC
jgi:hypothetical protein